MAKKIKLTRAERLERGLGRRAAAHKPTEAHRVRVKVIPRKAKHKALELTR